MDEKKGENTGVTNVLITKVPLFQRIPPVAFNSTNLVWRWMSASFYKIQFLKCGSQVIDDLLTSLWQEFTNAGKETIFNDSPQILIFQNAKVIIYNWTMLIFYSVNYPSVIPCAFKIVTYYSAALMNTINRYKVVAVNNLTIAACKIWKLTSGHNTFDSCWANSSSFCCNGVLSSSVSTISSRILPVNWPTIFLKFYWRDDIKKNHHTKQRMAMCLFTILFIKVFIKQTVFFTNLRVKTSSNDNAWRFSSSNVGTLTNNN